MGTSAEPRIPTVAKPAAGRIAWGVLLTGLAHLIPVAYGSQLDDLLQNDLMGVLWVAPLAGILGIGILTSGVLRMVQHFDRAAGVTYAPLVRATEYN